MIQRTLTGIALAALFGAASAVSVPAQDPTCPMGGQKACPKAAQPGQPAVSAVATQDQPRQLRLRQPGARNMLRNRLLGLPPGPRLGVMVETGTDGLKVTEVDEGSLAASAGVQAGDIVYRIAEERVETVGDVARALSAFTPGDTVPVTVIRAGEGLVELNGTLPEPPPAPEAPDVPLADGHRGGFLGVEVGDSDDDAAGVVVAGTIPNSAAWFAGLEEGDRLLKVDDTAVDSFEVLTGAVATKKPGTPVELTYERGGEQHSITVRLGDRNAGGPLSMLLAPGRNQGFNVQVPRLRMPGRQGSELWFDDLGGGDLFRMLDPDGLAPFDFDVRIEDDANGPTLRFGGPGSLHGLNDLLGPLDGTSRSIEVNIENGQGTATVRTDAGTKTYTLKDGRWIEDGQGPKTTEDEDGPELREG